jgi:hypothetical protein
MTTANAAAAAPPNGYGICIPLFEADCCLPEPPESYEFAD